MALLYILIGCVIILGLIIMIMLLSYKSSVKDVKNKMDLLEKFIDPATLVKIGEIEEIRKICSTISEKIAQLKTQVEQQEKSQFEISRASSETISTKIESIISSLQGLIEGIKEKSEPIPKVQESAEEIKSKVTELWTKLLGSKEKGQIGEKVLYEQLSKLPVEWLKKDVEFENGAKVEFAIPIADKYIPIDSKFVDIKNEKKIGEILFARAREVEKYAHSSKSFGFAIMAIPDALQEEGLKIYSKSPSLSQNIIIVPYSNLLYTILFIIANKERILASVNTQKILGDLPRVPKVLEEVIQKTEKAKSELTSAQNRISELKEKLQECYMLINTIISSK